MFRRSDCDSLGQLADIVHKSAYSNTAVLFRADNGEENWTWYVYIKTFEVINTNRLIVYVEKQPVTWKECYVVYWCEKARKRMIR